jgi:ribosomal-protein-alanine N-acetyltransferase
MIAVAKDLPPTIRPMCQSDIAGISAIENDTYDFPWSSGIFRDCLLAGYTNIVLDHDGDVVGYGVMSIAAGEAHLLNICVEGNLRRNGEGRRLLGHLLGVAREAISERVFLEVRPSNEIAMALYHSVGFSVLGIRPAYYKSTQGSEDAVVLVYHFGDDS